VHRERRAMCMRENVNLEKEVDVRLWTVLF